MKNRSLYRVPLYAYILAEDVEQMESVLDVLLENQANSIIPELFRTVEISSEHELCEIINSRDELFKHAIDAVWALNGAEIGSSFTNDNVLSVARSLERAQQTKESEVSVDPKDITELMDALKIVNKIADKYKPTIYPVD